MYGKSARVEVRKRLAGIQFQANLVHQRFIVFARPGYGNKWPQNIAENHVQVLPKRVRRAPEQRQACLAIPQP